MSGSETHIGSALDCDIVLTDAGISAHHVTFETRGRGRGRKLAITAHAPGVIVAGEELPLDDARLYPLPASIDIGPARLDVKDQRTYAERGLNMWVALPAAVAAGAGLGLLITYGAGLSSPPPIAVGPGAPARVAQTGSVPSGASIALNDVQTVMRQQLAANGLDKHIRIVQRDNVISAEGELPLEKFAAWRQVKATINAHSKERLIIAEMVRPIETEEGPRGMIAAVSLGAKPAVVGMNGKRAGIGEMLGDGWIVRQITAAEVQLERGSSRVNVKLSP